MARLKTVTEGRTKLAVPGEKRMYDAPIFYNPRMEFSRDLSLCCINAYSATVKNAAGLVVCDPLAATGSRGIRYAKEARGIATVALSDIDPVALRFMRRNVALNRLSGKVSVSCKDANVLLHSNKRAFDVVDIDPFGSPAYFFDAAARSVKKRALFACTATDTAALSGTSPRACHRRYGARVALTDCYREVGPRTLLAAIAQAFARQSTGITPLVTHATEHYFRAFCLAEYGKRRADKSLDSVGFVSYCNKCLYRAAAVGEKCPHCGSALSVIGPLWLGGIEDAEFCLSAMQYAKGKNKEAVVKLLGQLAEEAGAAPLYYDIHELCHRLGCAPPPLHGVTRKLAEMGFRACRTCFCPTGIKTDAGIVDIEAAVVSPSMFP